MLDKKYSKELEELDDKYHVIDDIHTKLLAGISLTDSDRAFLIDCINEFRLKENKYLGSLSDDELQSYSSRLTGKEDQLKDSMELITDLQVTGITISKDDLNELLGFIDTYKYYLTNSLNGQDYFGRSGTSTKSAQEIKKILNMTPEEKKKYLFNNDF